MTAPKVSRRSVNQRFVACRFIVRLILAGALAACSHGIVSDATDNSSGDDMSRALEFGEWPTYGGNYTNLRFSPLSQINTNNVSHLVPAYVFQTGVPGPLETSPIVSGGAMYITTANDGIAAINAETGAVIWKRPPMKGKFRQCCGPVNRGVAIGRGLVFLGRLDGRLIALDRKTGKTRWSAQVANNEAGYSITMAPLFFANSVYVGVGGGEFGIRGSLSSYSATTGKLQWRWYATDPRYWFGPSALLLTDEGRADAQISARLRRGFSSSWRRGGGGIWSTPALDVRTKTLYVSTGNPWPDDDGGIRPGDNLFTDCIVALDASTGRMKWYFQEIPHDRGDLDAASPPILFDTVDRDGHVVAAVGEIGKTGLLYALNRNTGRVIRVSQNLASLASRTSSTQMWFGGSSWSPASVDVNLDYVIISASQHLRKEFTSERAAAAYELLHGWSSGYGTVTALNISTGNIVWQDRFDEGLIGGSVSTAGGLTFVGEADGYFDALDTRSGARLWKFQTGAGVNAPPIVFQAGDREYVAVASGGNQQVGTPYGDAIFVFSPP